MKNLFDATRALLAAHRKHELELPPALHAALHAFEMRNRGHRHLLNAPAMAPTRGWREPDVPTAERRNTLRDTLASLMSALHAMSRDQMPKHPVFEQLWTAQDDTGWLGALLPNDLGWNGPLPFGLYEFRQRHDGREWLIQATFRHWHSKLMARREWRLPAAPATSLESCWMQLRDAKRFLRDATRDLQTWPEFTAEARTRSLLDEAKRKLDEALSGFSDADCAELATRWSSLMPRKLARAEACR